MNGMLFSHNLTLPQTPETIQNYLFKPATFSFNSLTEYLLQTLEDSVHQSLSYCLQGSCTRRSFDSTNLYNTYYQWVSIFLMIQVSDKIISHVNIINSCRLSSSTYQDVFGCLWREDSCHF